MLPTLELFSTEQETDLLTTLLQLRLDMLVRLQGEYIFFLELLYNGGLQRGGGFLLALCGTYAQS